MWSAPKIRLRSLKIEGFRVFRSLHVDRLGRVNLLVGRNNIGKTTVLEALELYASGGDLEALRELLVRRDEMSMKVAVPNDPRALLRLFHQAELPHTEMAITATQDDHSEPRGLEIRAVLARLVRTSEGYERVIVAESEVDLDDPDVEPALRITRLDGNVITYPFRAFLRRPLRGPTRHEVLPNANFVPSGRLSPKDLSSLWDATVLTPREEDLVNALRIIEPKLRRLSMIEVPGRADRVPLVLRDGQPGPEPLRSMGDGMSRIFEVTLALTASEGGLLLVDEIETGVHFAALEAFWMFVFEVAVNLDVQVFATTHSWDCIRAFQAAAAAHPADGSLVRLHHDPNGNVVSTTFDEEELAIVARRDIEVR